MGLLCEREVGCDTDGKSGRSREAFGPARGMSGFASTDVMIRVGSVEPPNAKSQHLWCRCRRAAIPTLHNTISRLVLWKIQTDATRASLSERASRVNNCVEHESNS